MLWGFCSVLRWTSDLSSGLAGGVTGTVVGAGVGAFLSIIGMLTGLIGYFCARRLGLPGSPIGGVGAGFSVAGLVALMFYGENLSVALLTPASLAVSTLTAYLLLPSWSESTRRL